MSTLIRTDDPLVLPKKKIHRLDKQTLGFVIQKEKAKVV